MTVRMTVVLLGIGLMVAMTAGIAAAASEVSGVIASNTTWTVEQSPYIHPS